MLNCNCVHALAPEYNENMPIAHLSILVDVLPYALQNIAILQARQDKC